MTIDSAIRFLRTEASEYLRLLKSSERGESEKIHLSGCAYALREAARQIARRQRIASKKRGKQ